MRTPRSLRVESVEDRITPATITLISMGLYGPIYSTFSFQDRGGDGRVASQSHDISRMRLFEFTRNYDYPVVVRIINWGGNWNTVAEPAPTPTPVSGTDYTSSDVAAASTPLVVRSPGRGSNSSTAKSGTTTDQNPLTNSNVSVPVSVPGASDVDSNSANEGVSEIASRQVTPNVPPVAVESRPTYGHMSVPIMGGIEYIDVPVAVAPEAPQSEEPPSAPVDPAPAMPEGNTSTYATPASVIVTGEPTPGVFPFNMSAIEAGVRGVLNRVAGLEEGTTETPGSTENYLWLGAATLIAGGVAQAAWTRRTQPADPRTLGLDSVLTRWGEKYVGC